MNTLDIGRKVTAWDCFLRPAKAAKVIRHLIQMYEYMMESVAIHKEACRLYEADRAQLIAENKALHAENQFLRGANAMVVRTIN